MGICSSSSEPGTSLPKYTQYRQLGSLEDQKGKIICLKELMNHNIITGDSEGEIKIWNLENKSCIKTIELSGKIFCILEFEQDKLLIGGTTNNIDLYDINESPEKLIHKFEGHKYWVNDLVKCDENYFASSSNDGSIRIWDYKNKSFVHALNVDNRTQILCLIKLNDGRLCTGNLDSTIKIWDWKNNKCDKTFGNNNGVPKCLCQLKNGDILSGCDNIIIAWNREVEHYKLEGHQKAVRYICQINDNYIASASFDKTIKIWNLKNIKKQACEQTLFGHNDFVTGIILHSSGKLISCSNDKTIKIWEK